MRKRATHLSVFLILAIALAGESATAQGLLGGALQWAGRAIGVKPVEDLGRNLDAEHKSFKDKNPAYANFEQTASELMRTPFGITCATMFDSIIGSVRASCNRMGSQSASATEQFALLTARERLRKLGVLTNSELSDVSIKWCQGDFLGYGIVPAPNEIILNKAILSQPLDDIVSTIAHEMHHVRQFRSMGAAAFKCNYVQHYIACGGCQNSSHPMEAEALRFEAAIAKLLVASTDSNARYDPQSRVMSAITTYGGITAIPTQPGEVKESFRPAEPPSPNKRARQACTLTGWLPSPTVNCIESLATVLAKVDAMISEDKRNGAVQPPMFYIRSVRPDINPICERVAADPRISKPSKTHRLEHCEIQAEEMIDDRVEMSK